VDIQLLDEHGNKFVMMVPGSIIEAIAMAVTDKRNYQTIVSTEKG